MDTQGIEVAAVTEETAEDIAAREAEKERRVKQTRALESATTVAISNAILAMPQFKNARVSKIEAGGKYSWRGEVEVTLTDGTKLAVTVQAQLPGDE